MQAGQLDFSIRVAVCAWCKPRGPVSTGAVLSHGICPRHLRKLEQEMQGVTPKRRRRVAPQDRSSDEGLLPL